MINMDINPKLADFKKLAKKHNLIVLSCRFYSDWLTPLSVYYGLSKSLKSESFLLESVEGVEKVCRFSFLGLDPVCVFQSSGKNISIRTAGGERNFETSSDPLSELKELMNSYKVAPKESLRFFGGFVGYMGYDTVRFYEPVGREKPDTIGSPDAIFMLPKFLVIFDHLIHQIEVLSFVSVPNGRALSSIYHKEKKALEIFCRKITRPLQLPALTFRPKKLKLTSNFKKKDFLKAVRSAKKHIKEGDIIQTVLSQRFSLSFKGDPLMAYRYLRILNPSPYMFHLRFRGLEIVGASPEMLLRCENGELITRPIAGTRKRGRDEREDVNLERELLADPKEKAEHIMLVDLARNDLGRVSRKGSIKIPVFMEVERFSHVMHIVSEVRGRLAKKDDLFTSLASCFPAGTVSGAPKVRAMQIINQLEPDKRGIYAGTVGYFSFTNSLDTCIIIRTIVFKGKKAYIQAGAGIVADSVPENEYRETVSKARAQLLALEYV
jgi:anthranilate synthase component I